MGVLKSKIIKQPKTIKILVSGPSKSGKTVFISTIIGDQIDLVTYKETFAIGFYEKRYKRKDGQVFRLTFYDTAGNSKYRKYFSMFYDNTTINIIIYTDQDKKFREYIDLKKNLCPQAKLILVKNAIGKEFEKKNPKYGADGFYHMNVADKQNINLLLDDITEK